VTWYCVRTATRREKTAEASLRELGVQVYVPRETRWERLSPRQERAPKQAPLLAGYIFADLTDNQIHLANEAEGVSCIVSSNRADGTRRPTPVKVAELYWLAYAESQGMFDWTYSEKPRKWTPKKGDEAKVTSGQYTGFIGQVLELRGRNRALLLVHLFGRPAKIERPISELQAA